MAKSVSFDVEVDDSVFKKDTATFLAKIGKEEKDFIREQSGMVARDLAKYTPPFVKGTWPDFAKDTIGTSADIKAGKNAIEGGLKSICFRIKKKTTINKAIKDFGRNAPVYKGKQQIAFGVIDNIKDLSNWHYKNRTSQGRVLKVATIQRPMVWLSVFNKYVKRRQEDVGIAKAGFYKASLRFGAKEKAPPNIKKNVGKAAGLGILKQTKDGWVGHISGTSKGAEYTVNKLPMIQRNRGEKAAKRLEILVKKRAKKDFS